MAGQPGKSWRTGASTTTKNAPTGQSEKTSKNSWGRATKAYVDKGYRGHDTSNPRRVFLSVKKRGVNTGRPSKKLIERRLECESAGWGYRIERKRNPQPGEEEADLYPTVVRIALAALPSRTDNVQYLLVFRE